jgi:hypothetical protein
VRIRRTHTNNALAALKKWLHANVTSQRPKKIAALLNLPEQGELAVHAFGAGSKVPPVLFHSLHVLSHPKQYLAMLWQCLILAPLKKGEKMDPTAKTYFQIDENAKHPACLKFMGAMLNILRADFSVTGQLSTIVSC